MPDPLFLLGVSVSGSMFLPRGLPPGSLCPGGQSLTETPRQRPPGQRPPMDRGGLSREGLCQGVPWTETSHTVKSGRYAFYWNAFLSLHLIFLVQYGEVV